eukprot:TRINITY_DN730_c0_g1_i6.p1 TRINITY_DN730_c0_g1~~TRINITY_DN730_c0_g1_i6.p1  ORF type:complete len:243 (-),score=54.60 TRINITY_DN730_c0_g1_i6:295-1023(-)
MSSTQQPVSEAAEVATPQIPAVESVPVEETKQLETPVETQQKQEEVKEVKAEAEVVEEPEAKPEVEKAEEKAEETPAPKEPAVVVVPPVTAPVVAPEPAKEEGEEQETAPTPAPVSAPTVVQEESASEKEAKPQKTGSGKKPHPVLSAIGSIFKRSKSNVEVEDVSVVESVSEVKQDIETVPEPEVNPLDLLKQPDVLEDTLTKITSSKEFKKEVEDLKLEGIYLQKLVSIRIFNYDVYCTY